MLFVFFTNAQVQEDKKLHFAAGVISGFAGYEYVYSKTKNKKKAFAAGVLTSVLAGAAKETFDSTQSNNKFDLNDLAATALGGLSVNVTIKLFNKNKNKNEKNINITLLNN
tara:strand:+ start:4385 stop:4717 length:333 start_codon:yes stop_codon:yes gene_type:complete